MKKLSLYLVLGIVAFSTGCPKYRPKVDFDNPGSFVNKLNKHIMHEQDRYNCYSFSLAYPCSSDKQTAALPDGPDRARIIRNDLLEDAISYIDDAYMDFITDLQAGRDRNNFVADLVELGASAAVGITNGERPLQIIGVGLTAFRGGRRSADLNFYKEQTTPILISKMDGNRSRVYAEILQKKSRGVDQYSMKEAIRDMVAYYNAGTLVRAFTELNKQTSLDAEIARLGVLKLQGMNDITQIPTAEQREIVVNIHTKLRTLDDDLDSQDQATRDRARDFIKSTYEKIAKRAEFEDIIKKIGSSFENDETLSDGSKATLRSAFDKLSRNESLTGQEYLALVNTVVNKAETPELQKLLLSIFNEQ